MTTQTGALDRKEIVDAAQRETGHYGLVDDGLLTRLGRLIDYINERGPYTAARCEEMQHQIRLLLSTRLRLAGDRRRLPAIAAEQVERPIFVIGFPRTGTTLLHSLLAEDPATLAPRALHSHEPSPPPGEGPIAAQRTGRTRRDLERMLDQIPGLLALHPYWDKLEDALIEDEELFTLDFRNAYPTLLYRVPTLSVMVNIGDEDAGGAFGFHREVLQHLQWNTGHKRWACKGVGHQFLLEQLFAVYPDALCVWPHRDPVEIQASTLAISVVVYDSITGRHSDWKPYARAWVEGMKLGLDHAMASPLIDDPRIMHLDFREVAADPVSVVRKVYDRGGLDFTPGFEQRIRAWLADPSNRTDRYGRYRYTYEPFGLEAGWVRELFTDYRRRFNLP
jgi:hypothetical protein